MFAAIQPPVKLSLLCLTLKKGTNSWGLVKFFPWKGKKGRGQTSHFLGEEGNKSMQLVFREGVLPLSLSLLHLYPS